MKSSILFLVFFSFGFFSFSQTSSYIEIIEPEKKQKPLLLAIVDIPTETFNSKKYSLELKQQLTNYSFSPINADRMSTGWLVLSPGAFKPQAYDNFTASYKRLELKRLLPGPPSFENFCPEFTY